MAEREAKDRSGSWLIETHGDSMLRIAGITGFRSWRAVRAEVVLPKQTPDGMLEVFFDDQPETPDPFLIEIATYPDRRVEDQMMRNAYLVAAARGILPDMLTLVLHPRGDYRLRGNTERRSRHDWTRFTCQWQILEMWTVLARQLLDLNDVGAIPWATLTAFAGPPELLLQECRDRIDQQARPEEHANLLAVTQVLARLRFPDPQLLALFGGSRVMIESPLIQELLTENTVKTRRLDIARLLTARFGTLPPELQAELRAITDERKLEELIPYTIQSPDLAAFRAKLVS